VGLAAVWRLGGLPEPRAQQGVRLGDGQPSQRCPLAPTSTINCASTDVSTDASTDVSVDAHTDASTDGGTDASTNASTGAYTNIAGHADASTDVSTAVSVGDMSICSASPTS